MNKKKLAALLDFIRTYRNLPELWDTNDKHYSNRAKKSDAYEVLVEKLRVLEPDSTRHSVVAKINSLRSSFRKEVRKVKRSQESGADPIYRPNLWYFDELLFLLNQEGTNSRPQTQTLKKEGNKVENENICFVFDDEPAPSSSDHDSSPPPAKKRNNHHVRHGHMKEISSPSAEERLLSIASNYIQKEDDEYLIMSRAYAEKMRKLDPMQLLFADRVINEVLLEAQMQNLTRWSSVTLNTEVQANPDNYVVIANTSNVSESTIEQKLFSHTSKSS